MDPFEYLVTLVSVLVGLAIADLATSLHRLLRAGGRVHWDGLPLGAALLALLAVLNFWWVIFAGGIAQYDRIGGFLPLAAQLVVLFLLSAAALPDAVPPEGLDLRTFYRQNTRYFWSLYIGYIFLVTIPPFTEMVREAGGSLPATIHVVGPNLVILASFTVLAFTHRRWVHALGISAWLIVLLLVWWDLRLVTP